MKTIVVLFLSLSLVACGGGSSVKNLDSGLDPSIPKFSLEELQNSLLVSKTVLGENELNSEGSLLFFDNTSMREFSLTKKPYTANGLTYFNESANFTDQSWLLLDDGRIQISYPQGITCYTKKESDYNDTNKINVTGECTNNVTMEQTVLKPLPFNVQQLQGKKIITMFESTRETYEFKDDGTFDLTYDNFSETLYPQGSGTFTNSKYKNTVRINFPIAYQYGGYSELFLVEGDLSQGKIVEVRYNTESDYDVLIYTVTENNSWQAHNYYLSVF